MKKVLPDKHLYFVTYKTQADKNMLLKVCLKKVNQR